MVEVTNLLKQFGEMQKMMKSLGPGMTAAMKGGGGRLKQARAISKAVKSGDIDPAQLEALGLPGGVPGLGRGTAPSRPALPSLPASGMAKARPGAGRVTAPGTASGPSKNAKKKKKR